MGTSPLLALQIQPTDDPDHRGRSFTAACLGWVAAPILAKVAGRAQAPVFLALAGPVTTLKPFVANLLHGDERAVHKSGRSAQHILRLGKGQALRHRWHRDGQQSLVLAWHPAFELEPDPARMHADMLTFVTMPRRDWIERQAERFSDAKNPLLCARASYFCAFLSRRTRLPIANDPGFHLHLFDSALDASWTVQGTAITKSVIKVGLDGYESPILCSVKASTFEDWLRERTREYFGKTVKVAPARKAA